MNDHGSSSEEEVYGKSSIFATLFHWLMVIFSLTLIFCVSGTFVYLKLNGGAHESVQSAVLKFVVGGLLGVAVTLGIYFGKTRHVI